MKSKVTLKTREFSSIIINLITVKMLFTYPRYIVQKCENSAWLAVLLATVAACGIYYITQKLYTSCGKVSILSQAEYLGGKAFKIFIGLILYIVIATDIVPMIRACPEAVKTALLQNSNMIDIVVILAIGILLGTYNGIEALGRAASIFLPFAAAFMFAFFLMVIPHFDVNNLFPLSLKKTAINGSSALSIFSDIIVINLLMPYCGDSKTIKKGGFSAIIISGIAGFLITISYCLVFSYPVSSYFISPMYQLARIINIGMFFQRLEAAFEFIWTISNLFYTSVYLFVLCDIFKHCFNLKSYRPIVFPVMVLLFWYVFYWESYSDAMSYAYSNINIIFPIIYILPLLIGGLYLIRRRRNERGRKI